MLWIHEALTLKLSSSAPEVTRACVLLFWRSLFGKDGWILPLFFFCAFVDLDFASVLKNTKKNSGNIQPSWPYHWSVMLCKRGCSYSSWKITIKAKFFVCLYPGVIFLTIGSDWMTKGWRSSRWPIHVLNSVVNTKLPANSDLVTRVFTWLFHCLEFFWYFCDIFFWSDQVTTWFVVSGHVIAKIIGCLFWHYSFFRLCRFFNFLTEQVSLCLGHS